MIEAGVLAAGDEEPASRRTSRVAGGAGAAGTILGSAIEVAAIDLDSAEAAAGSLRGACFVGRTIATGPATDSALITAVPAAGPTTARTVRLRPLEQTISNTRIPAKHAPTKASKSG